MIHAGAVKKMPRETIHPMQNSSRIHRHMIHQNPAICMRKDKTQQTKNL